MAVPSGGGGGGAGGVAQRIKLLWDKAAAALAREEAAEAGRRIGDALGDKAVPPAAAGGKKAAKALLKGLDEEYDARIAALRRQWAAGLISEADFRRRGQEAARAFNQGLLTGSNQLRADNKITDKQFVDLSNRLKETGDVGVNSFARIRGEIRTWINSGWVQSVGLGMLAMGLREVINEANALQGSLMGLASVAQAFGTDQHEAQRAAQALARDGLMRVGDAASGLKNLLAAGFGLPEAINLMNRLRDAAAFNRQGTLAFGDAIVRATEGIKNGNSALVDNAGVTKNLSVILTEAGYSAQDMAKATTDAGVRQALYNGIIKETAPFLGDAARYADTAAGSMAKLQAQTDMAQATLGTKLQPAVKLVSSGLSTMLMPPLNFVIALVEMLSTGLGALVGALAIVEGKFEVFFNRVELSITQFAANLYRKAKEVPLLGTMFGMDNALESTADALDAHAARLERRIAAIQANSVSIRALLQAADEEVARIWRERNSGVPLATVPDRPGARTGATTPTGPQGVTDAMKAEAKYLEDGLRLRTLNNAERARALELERQLLAMGRDAALSHEQRSEALDLAGSLQSARERRPRGSKTDEQLAAERKRLLDEEVSSLATLLQGRQANNADLARAVDLERRYRLEAVDSARSVEDRADSEQRANRLRDARTRGEEEMQQVLMDEYELLQQGNEARVLGATEQERMLELEGRLRLRAFDANVPLKQRLEYIRAINDAEEKRGYRTSRPTDEPDAPPNPWDQFDQDSTDILALLMGTLEGSDPQGFFEEMFAGIGVAAMEAADGMVDAWQSAFEVLGAEGRTLGDAFAALGAGIAGSLTGALASFARKKVSENVASAIENVAKGMAAGASPFTAWMAPGYYRAAAHHGVAAAAWAALAGGAGAVTSALTGGGGGGERNVGGDSARDAQQRGTEVHIHMDPLSENNPRFQVVSYRAVANAEERLGEGLVNVYHHTSG